MRTRASAVVAAFLLAAVWYFFPAVTWHVFPADRETFPSLLFAMRLALPAAILAVGGIGLLPCLMTLGFCFCTLGDAMGVAGSFEGQMGGFALAQICFIAEFAKDIRRSAQAVPPRKPHPVAFMAATLLCLPPLILAALKVIPAVKELPIRIGCTFYALLLVLASWTSIVRAFTFRNYIAMTGCLCFLVSDFILSWNKFTEHIPQASLLIMSTYYAALLFLFCGTVLPRTFRTPGRA